MNDIFLTICGGALRRYLMAKKELPEASLRALMPISLRTANGDAGKGNEVGMAPVMLRTEIADPVARLRAVHGEAEVGKRGAELIGPEMVLAINEALPFAVANYFMRKQVISQLNCTVSNVRGPDVPLYIAGARAVHFYPVSIPMDGVAMNYTGFSYNNVLWISCVSCRNLMPDPAFMADCLRASAAELHDAALAAFAVPTASKNTSKKIATGRKPAARKPTIKESHP